MIVQSDNNSSQMKKAQEGSRSSNIHARYDLLTSNAFRMLGISITASKREILKRVEEIETFVAIGQTPEFKTDLVFIGELYRNKETIENALQALENPKTKLLHILSWFWVLDKFDNLAIEQLKNKNIDSAANIWSQKQNGHHKKNLAVLETILALLNPSNDYIYLNSSIRYWAEFISSVDVAVLISSFDQEITKKYAGAELIDILVDYFNRLTRPFLEKWRNENDLLKIKKFFFSLNRSGLPPKIVASIKEGYLEPLSTKIDKLCDGFSDLGGSDDYEKLYRDTIKFNENIEPYYAQIKSSEDDFVIEHYGDKIGNIILNNSIDYGNKTDQWEKSKELCMIANSYIIGTLLRERFESNIKIISKNVAGEKTWGNLKPISKAPGLGTFNGFGLKLYGRSNYDEESGSYETTRYFVMLYIPIFPVDRYRVIDQSNNVYRFIGKVPFRTFDKWHLAIAILASLIFLSNIMSEKKHTAPSSYNPPSSYTQPPAPAQPRAAEMKQRIATAKQELKSMEDEFRTTEDSLDSMKSQLSSLKMQLEQDQRNAQIGLFVDELAYDAKRRRYNNMVNDYNATFAAYKDKYREYKDLLDATNRDVHEYNALIK